MIAHFQTFSVYQDGPVPVVVPPPPQRHASQQPSTSRSRPGGFTIYQDGAENDENAVPTKTVSSSSSDFWAEPIAKLPMVVHPDPRKVDRVPLRSLSIPANISASQDEFKYSDR